MSLFHTLRAIFLKSVVCFLLPGISWGMELESDFINQINPNKNIEKKQDIITTNNEAFYIFSVGQGNAQLAVIVTFPSFMIVAQNQALLIAKSMIYIEKNMNYF